VVRNCRVQVGPSYFLEGHASVFQPKDGWIDSNAAIETARAPPSGTEERYRISRDLCSANEAYRAGIFREFPIVGQQRNALHSRLSHKDAIERVLVSGR
jgi:hypothetical protein